MKSQTTTKKIARKHSVGQEKFEGNHRLGWRRRCSRPHHQGPCSCDRPARGPSTALGLSQSELEHGRMARTGPADRNRASPRSCRGCAAHGGIARRNSSVVRWITCCAAPPPIHSKIYSLRYAPASRFPKKRQCHSEIGAGWRQVAPCAAAGSTWLFSVGRGGWLRSFSSVCKQAAYWLRS
jgi:hypothetical protein